jgi:hypothetical protein
MEIEETYDVTIEKLRQEVRKIVKDIETFDCSKSTPEELEVLFKEAESLKLRIDDSMNDLEVEDFLLNGSRMQNTNI